MNEIIKLYHLVDGITKCIGSHGNGWDNYICEQSITRCYSFSEWVTSKSCIGRKIKSFISFDPPTTFQDVFETVGTTNKWLGPAYANCACAGVSRVPIDVMFSKIANGGW